jgi:hypothetical protein
MLRQTYRKSDLTIVDSGHWQDDPREGLRNFENRAANILIIDQDVSSLTLKTLDILPRHFNGQHQSGLCKCCNSALGIVKAEESVCHRRVALRSTDPKQLLPVTYCIFRLSEGTRDFPRCPLPEEDVTETRHPICGTDMLIRFQEAG